MAEELSEFIKNVGVPAAAFLVMAYLYYILSKKSNEIVREQAMRYEVLANNFVNTLKGITEKNTEALLNMSDKLDNHTKQKDEFMEMTNKMLCIINDKKRQ